jgi:AcrR family transcriptional regulator
VFYIPYMAYRRTERMEARLASNREILRATRDTVAERGFREAEIATIAAAAGVATGTIYRYFPSKADLFAEVVSTSSRQEVEVVAQIATSGGPAVQRLVEAVCVFARRALRGRKLAYALVAEPVEPEVDAARLAYRRALARVFEGILADGINAGEFPPQDVEASAACLVGALIEGLVGPLAPVPGAADDGENLVEAIALFCLRVVSGKDE